MFDKEPILFNYSENMNNHTTNILTQVYILKYKLRNSTMVVL